MLPSTTATTAPFSYLKPQTSEDPDTSPWITEKTCNHGHIDIREAYREIPQMTLDKLHRYIIALQHDLNKFDIFENETSSYEKKGKLSIAKNEDLRMLRHAEEFFKRRFKEYLGNLTSLECCEDKKNAPESEEELLKLLFSEQLQFMDGAELEMTIRNLDLALVKYQHDKASMQKATLERTMTCVKQISDRRFAEWYPSASTGSNYSNYYE